MRKPLFLVSLFLVAFTTTSMGQVAHASEIQKQYLEEHKQRQRDYFEDYIQASRAGY